MTARTERMLTVISAVLWTIAALACFEGYRAIQRDKELHALKAERDSLRSQLDSLTEMLR